ncbi:hypothetical protein SCHIN_v1c04980 [Spiroplasma chinense]|uniref:DUF4238 domain-containing protein n=1 Tax=Spiroplasma chinense TaxID=216932 RepID=A0A5B9Y4G3_9MOLU|nr:DUF4238 domain-containing protein [Spiroplasma chinense]QEH61695.1 hypothetical protein SCHIN_v1c04980 [Spiroplasma chinense]
MSKKKKKKTKKQHYIPRFVLRGFSDDGISVKVHYVLENTEKTIQINNSKAGEFWIKNLYEDEDYETNLLEDRLSLIESQIADIYIKKILKKDEIHLNRWHTKLLRLNALLDSSRAFASILVRENKKGGKIFNERNSKLTNLEIKKNFIERIKYLSFDVYDYMKKEADMLDEKGKGFISKDFHKTYEFFLGNTSYSELQESLSLKNEIEQATNSIYNLYTARTVFIRISDDLDKNFLYSDAQLVEFYGTKISEVSRTPILWAKIINPKNAIVYVIKDIPFNNDKSVFAKETFWDLELPKIFDAKNRFIPKDKNNSPYTRKNSNEDQYIFDKHLLVSDRQVDLINAMFLSQAQKEVVYVDEKDLKSAFKTIKEENIYRIEDVT